MSIRSILICGAAALALTLPGCKTETRPIQIGFCAGLSGKMSELGVSGRKGAEIAVEEINRQGGINGRPVELLVRDDKNNADEARRADSILIKEGCIAIIGHFTSGAVSKSLPLAESLNTIMISPTVSTTKLSGKKDNFFRTIPANRFQAELLARSAIKIHRSRRVSIIYEVWNSAYSEELSFYFRKEYEKLGGRITVVKSFTGGQEKFGQLAKELTSNGEDGILSIAAGADNAMLCQQLAKIGSNVKVYAGLWSMSDDLILHGGRTIERIFLAGVFDNECTSPAYVSFKEKYFSRFHTFPTFGSVFTYESCMVLFSALKECSSFGSRSIADKIIKTGKFRGLQQDFTIDQSGDADDRPYTLFTVKNGKFIKAG